MNRGFILFVQKNDVCDYLKQAVACSLSIKKIYAQRASVFDH
jgi:hypothetical protein